MLDDNHPMRNDEYGFPRQGFPDKSANRIRATKAAPAIPVATRPDATRPIRRRPRLELSLTQILGSTSAAVTAAFLGSRLGVAGTLIGAALASVISVVGGAIYTSSIKATRRRMAQVIVAVRSPDEEAVAEPAPVLMPLVGYLSTGDGTRRNPGSTTSLRRRPVLRGLAIGTVLSAAVFAGALVVVTGYETVSGTAISGGQVGGLTILGGSGIDTGSTDDSSPAKRSGSTDTETGKPTSTPASQNASGATTSRGGAPASGPPDSRPAAAGTAPAGGGTASGSTTGSGPAGTTVTTTVTATGSTSVTTPPTRPTPTTPTTLPTAATPATPTPAPSPTAGPSVPAASETGSATGTPEPTRTDGSTSTADSTTGADPSTTTPVGTPPGPNTPR